MKNTFAKNQANRGVMLSQVCLSYKKVTLKKVYSYFPKAWFPFHGKCHDHVTKTKRLQGWAVILQANRFVLAPGFDQKLVVVVVVISLMETRLNGCQSGSACP